ncbi:MAG: cyclic nucleotide-binding domain-containing protein [Chloroflexi bacterium]|nr:cyclic nucleotide-binding domain-containing protein [Chloroflexota bacterium]
MLSKEERIIVLKSVETFSETPDNVLAGVAPLLKEERIPAGKTIFEKGEMGDALYIVASGKIRIHDEGHTLNYFEKGDSFGEMALIDPYPRMASAVVEENALLFCMDQDLFNKLLIHQGEIAISIARHVIRLLRARVQDLTKERSKMEDMERTLIAQRMSSLM